MNIEISDFFVFTISLNNNDKHGFTVKVRKKKTSWILYVV